MFNFNAFGDEWMKNNEAMMKQWSEAWEKMIGQKLDGLVRDEKFVSEMSRAIAATMSGKSVAQRMMDETMAQMNLPTRTDMVKVLQKLTDLEERVLELTERLEDMEVARPAAPETAKPAAAKAKKAGK